MALPVLWWIACWAVAPSPWDIGARNAAGFALSPVAAWPARLGEWSALAGFLLDGPVTWLLWLVGALALVAAIVRSERVRGGKLVAGRTAGGMGRWLLAAPYRDDSTGVGLRSAAACHSGDTARGVWRRPPVNPRPDRAWAGRDAPAAAEHRAVCGADYPAPIPAPAAGADCRRCRHRAGRARRCRLPRAGCRSGGDHGVYTVGLDEVVDWLDAARTRRRCSITARWAGTTDSICSTPSKRVRSTCAGIQATCIWPTTPPRRHTGRADPVAASWSPERDLAISLAARNLALHERGPCWF